MKNNYAKVEKEYMTNPSVTIASLAEKYGLSVSTLYKYSRRQKWEQKRSEIGQKRTIAAIAKTEDDADAAWMSHKEKLRKLLDREIDKLSKESKPQPSAVAAIVRATQDARAMGVYGITLNEKKLLKEIENLDRQLKESTEDKTVKITIAGGDEYGV